MEYLKKCPKCGEKDYKITDYVVSLTLKDYFIPIIVGLIFSLLNPIGLICLGMVIFSSFPFTKYILIPRIDKKFDIWKKNRTK